MNCCDKPDIWTHNGRWPVIGTLVFGVCVRCSTIVVGRLHKYTPVCDEAILAMYHSPHKRWIYDELLIEQACIRDVLVPPATSKLIGLLVAGFELREAVMA